MLGYYGLPIVGVRVADSNVTGIDYDLGATAVLNGPQILQAWFIDRDGNRVDIDADNEAFAGKIVRRVHIFDNAASVYELDLLLTQWASGVVARWRAPALEVVSATGTTIVVTGKAFHSVVDDTSFFEQNLAIEAWTPDGQRVASSTTAVVSVTATTITTADDISGVLTAGDILRLSDLDSYDLEAAYLACSLRPWVYMADADEQLGTANETGDVYG